MSKHTPEELRLLAAVAPTWTDYMALKGAAAGINRQCSIGWHEECSDPEGEQCKCHCHPRDLWPRETMSKVFVTSHGRSFHDPTRHFFTGSGKVMVERGRAGRLGYEPCAYCFGGSGRLPAVGRDPSHAYLTLYMMEKG